MTSGLMNRCSSAAKTLLTALGKSPVVHARSSGWISSPTNVGTISRNHDCPGPGVSKKFPSAGRTSTTPPNIIMPGSCRAVRSYVPHCSGGMTSGGPLTGSDDSLSPLSLMAIRKTRAVQTSVPSAVNKDTSISWSRRPGRRISTRALRTSSGTGRNNSEVERLTNHSVSPGWCSSASRAMSADGGPPCMAFGSQGPRQASVGWNRFLSRSNNPGGTALIVADSRQERRQPMNPVAKAGLWI